MQCVQRVKRWGAVFCAMGVVATGIAWQSVQAAPAAKLDARTRAALVAALNDERRSEAQYAAVLKKHGEVLPWAHITQAEQRHQEALLALFRKYNVAVPKDATRPMTAPANLQTARQEGVRSEKLNVALYDGFLKWVKEPDIRATFTRLRDVSLQHHARAFENCPGGMGAGCGNRKGAGNGMQCNGMKCGGMKGNGQASGHQHRRGQGRGNGQGRMRS